MHKIINQKSIQKITAVIIVMIMCNFIMSGKVWAGYGAMSQDPGTSTSTTTTGQNTGSIKNATDAGIKSDDIKKMIKSQLNLDDDEKVNKVYTNCFDDVTKITVKYTCVPITGLVTLNSVETNVSTDDINNMVDGSYVANGGSQIATSGGTAVGTEGESASAGSYNQSVSDQEGADGGDIGGLLFGPLANLIQGIGDSVNKILQNVIIGDKKPVFYNSGFFSSESVKQVIEDNPVDSNLEDVTVVKDYIDTFTGKYGVPDIKLTPAEIFAGNVSAFDANFFKTNADHKQELGGSNKSIVEQLRNTVAKWYVALRNIAIVGLLSALLYIGIRIVISSSNGDKAKYKQFFVDWVVALCLIFFMHYIMAFTMTMSETVTDVLAGQTTSQGRIKQVNIKLVEKDGVTPYSDSGFNVYFSSNFTGVARIKADYSDSALRMGYSVLYIALTVYTAYFSFVYLKRLLMLAFFTMIAPLVALTYPLDKIKDGKAQAFNYWFKEYMFYALLQPMHMLLYTVFVSSALSVAANNLLYAIVALAFIVPAEKIVKQMFGIKGNTESTLGGFAGGALASQAFGMLRKGSQPPKKGGGGAPSGSKGLRQFKNPNTPNALDTIAGDAMGIDAQNAVATGVGAAAGAAVAQNSKPLSEMTDEEIAAAQEQNGMLEAPQGTPVEEMTQDQIAAMQEKNGMLEAGQVAPEEPNEQQNNNQLQAEQQAQLAQQAQQAANDQNIGKLARHKQELTNNFKTAVNDRWLRAGGAKGVLASVGKTGAKLAGRAAMMTTMGALGLGVGIVGGDMSDTLKGLGAGLTAGYATGGRLNSAVGNTFAGRNAVGGFMGDVIKGMGPERQRSDYIKSYKSNQENRNRLIEKNPNISMKDLNARLEQEAVMSYDTGITDSKTVSAAVDLEQTLADENVKGRDNHAMAVALTKLGENYDKGTFNDSARRLRAQQSLQQKFEKRINRDDAAKQVDIEIKNNKETLNAKQREERIRTKTSEMANAKAQKTLDYIEKMKK